MESKGIKFLDRQLDPIKFGSIGQALSSLFGLGPNRSRSLCLGLGFSPQLKLALIPARRLLQLERFVLDRLTLGRSLKKVYLSNIDRKKKVGLLAGLRHSQRLPVRGQRTHSNGRTARRHSLPSIS